MRVNGVELHVEPAVGAGDPLVLVHGGWTDHTTFAALVPWLARSFSVVSYDRRGHSRSERGPGPAPRRQDEDDLAAMVEALGGGPVHLVGSSYGASIALALAGRRPELVRGVVAHEPALLGLVPVPEVEALFARVWDQLAAGDVEGGTRRFFEDVVLGPGGWELVPEALRRAAMGNAQTFVDLREDPDWGMLDVTAVSRFPGPVVVTRADAGGEAVVSIAGGGAALSRVATTVADRIGRPLRVIAGAGHAPHITHPEAFAAVIEAAIGGRAVARAA